MKGGGTRINGVQLSLERKGQQKAVPVQDELNVDILQLEGSGEGNDAEVT